jgi:hypothetical protein
VWCNPFLAFGRDLPAIRKADVWGVRKKKKKRVLGKVTCKYLGIRGQGGRRWCRMKNTGKIFFKNRRRLLQLNKK